MCFSWGKPSIPQTTRLLFLVQPASHTCLQRPLCFTSTAPSVTGMLSLARARMGLSRTSSRLSPGSCRSGHRGGHGGSRMGTRGKVRRHRGTLWPPAHLSQVTRDGGLGGGTMQALSRAHHASVLTVVAVAGAPTVVGAVCQGPLAAAAPHVVQPDGAWGHTSRAGGHRWGGPHLPPQHHGPHPVPSASCPHPQPPRQAAPASAMHTAFARTPCPPLPPIAHLPSPWP